MVGLFVCTVYINFSCRFFLSFWFCSIVQLLLENILYKYIKFKFLPSFLYASVYSKQDPGQKQSECELLLPDYWIKRAWSACITGALPYFSTLSVILRRWNKNVRIKETQSMTKSCSVVLCVLVLQI